MASLRKNEGYLLIDHRESPGVPDQVVVANGLPAGAGHGVFESATYTCSHCCRVVFVNPLRTRERGYCPKCDHQICDTCEAVRVTSGGECRTYKQHVDEVQSAASKGGITIVTR